MEWAYAASVWFDSHCHLDFEAFDADRARVWQRARDLGVTELFVPGVTPAQWVRLAGVRAQIPEARLGVGLHPYFLHELSSSERQRATAELPEWAERLGAQAIGECGLDGRWAKRGVSLDEQVPVLAAQLTCARELRLPVVLHVVQAHGRALELLEAGGPLLAGGVLHSYSGAAELVERYCKLGLCFGFSGAVTRPNATKARAALRAVPLDRLLLETDAPDQPPSGFVASPEHPRRNEPGALPAIAALVAELRGLALDELARHTTHNARALFGAGVSC